MNYSYIIHFKKSHKKFTCYWSFSHAYKRSIFTLSGDNRKILDVYIFRVTDNKLYCPRDPLLFIHSAEGISETIATGLHRSKQ